MQIGVVGLNHKTASLALREKLTKICHRFMQTAEVPEQHSLVFLTTCNRVEIYFSSTDVHGTCEYLLRSLRKELGKEAEEILYTHFKTHCFEHLARVTSGIDSVVMGETEIQGQVKRSYEKAKEKQCLDSSLHYCFQKCLKIGKEIRSMCSELVAIPSLERTVWLRMRSLFQEGKVLFVGASEINSKVIRYLQSKKRSDQLFLCNRSQERGALFAEREGIQCVSWEELENCGDYDVVVVGTKAPGYLITNENFQSKDPCKTRLIVDLSVPRNVDPSVGGEAFSLINIEELHDEIEANRRVRVDKVMLVEQKIQESVARYIDLHRKKQGFESAIAS